MVDINVGGVIANPNLFTIVDVRTPREFEAFHIPNSINIPLGDLESRYPELDKDAKIVCLCRSGSRSQNAAHFLVEKGFDVRNITGGILAWCKKELDKEIITDLEYRDRVKKINVSAAQ